MWLNTSVLVQCLCLLYLGYSNCATLLPSSPLMQFMVSSSLSSLSFPPSPFLIPPSPFFPFLPLLSPSPHSFFTCRLFFYFFPPSPSLHVVHLFYPLFSSFSFRLPSSSSLPPPPSSLYLFIFTRTFTAFFTTFLPFLLSFLLHIRSSSPPLTMLPPILRPLVRMLLTSIRGLQGSHLISLSCRARLRRSSNKLIV